MLLEPIALDSVSVAEDGGRRVAVMDLLEVKPAAPAIRVERAVNKLADIVHADELKPINAVEITVSTRWPSVSLAFARQLVDEVNRFNLKTRKSQAAAERQFVEARAAEAERALRDAENHLQVFLQENRIINPSSESAFQRDRMQRDVSRLTQVFTSLVQGLEDARIREVRDTPVITVIAEPELAALPQSRGTIARSVLGAFAGAFVGLLLALFGQSWIRLRRQTNTESREFVQLVHEVTPPFIHGRKS
jgi:uncharacterized protein involved in exopolysaccharide biosynthesis